MTRGPSQGEALATWALWGLTTVMVLVTYSWVDPAETYHVSRHGIVGGLSRSVTLINFPIALIAIALLMVAVAALPRSAWWAGAPAIALCATIPWFVDQANLDAHWGNAIPALGVAIAAVLTGVATRRAGVAFAPRRPWDAARVAVSVVVLLLSLPWITANLGFNFPGDFFMGEEPGRDVDGMAITAVHLGHHHGLDGAILILSVLLLSRMSIPARGLRVATYFWLGAMFSYGAVNLAQDGWNEQFVKRGWVETGIPSALVPAAKPIWLVVIAFAVIAAYVLLREDKAASYSAP